MGRKKRRTRKINGAGSITKLAGNRAKPWMVRVPGIIKRPVLGYFKTSDEAEIALAKYKISPFNVDVKNTTLDELWEMWYEKKKMKLQLNDLMKDT